MRSGLRVYLVDDEPLLLMELEDKLAELGCIVAGSASRIETALARARELAFDVAVLDVNLGTTRIDPVAEAIAERALPIVFLTGYGPDFKGRPRHGIVLEKPCTKATLERALSQAMEERNA